MQCVLEADGCGWVAHEVVGCGGVEVVRGTVGWDVVVRQSVRRGLQRLLDVLLLLAEFNSFIYLISILVLKDPGHRFRSMVSNFDWKYSLFNNSLPFFSA